MSPSQFLQFGLELMGYDLARQRRVRAAENLARFRSNYGVGPGAISAAFHQLQETEIAEAKIDKPNSFYFLIAMPSIGFVFITRKSRWPAFFVQTTTRCVNISKNTLMQFQLPEANKGADRFGGT